MKCRYCGCTDMQACEGGCWWAAPGVCSQCADKVSTVRERPILFSASMVRAIFDGTKTQTRRVLKFNAAGRAAYFGKQWHPEDPNIAKACPYGQPGDRLWVKETFAHWSARELFGAGMMPVTAFRAGRTWINGNRPEYAPGEVFWADDDKPASVKWTPSIHMPRRLSRITLEITEVHAQRLQDISFADVVAEGVRIPVDAATGNVLIDISSKFAPAKYLPKRSMSLRARRNGRTTEWNLHLARAHYASLWDEINGAGAWDANPWVWALAFKRVTNG